MLTHQIISYNTFASAGSDGTVSIWDHKSKKRLRQYQKYNAPVPSIAFNCDGTKLAVGVSYTWEEGEEGAKTAERPAVYIRTVGDEVKVSFLYSASRYIFTYAAFSPRDGLRVHKERLLHTFCIISLVIV